MASAVRIVDDDKGDRMGAAWVRDLKSDGSKVYSGFYRVGRLPDNEQPHVHVSFPLESGSIQVFLTPPLSLLFCNHSPLAATDATDLQCAASWLTRCVREAGTALSTSVGSRSPRVPVDAVGPSRGGVARGRRVRRCAQRVLEPLLRGGTRLHRRHHPGAGGGGRSHPAVLRDGRAHRSSAHARRSPERPLPPLPETDDS